VETLLPYGNSVRPRFVPPATQGVTPQASTFIVSRRLGPAVFGRGWIEAVDDAEILQQEQEQATRLDGVSGRVNRVRFLSAENTEQPYHRYTANQAGLIGRFGLKSRIASIDDFVADAYQGDMGITSPMRARELLNPDNVIDDQRAGVDVPLQTVNAVADYVRMLAIPKRAQLSPEGAAAFEKATCTSCHVPSMHTRKDYPISALADQDAYIYSDLLLHDMGEGLADGIEEHGAGRREWRTAPLIGIRHLKSYLHDGRASLEQAVFEHKSPGSEANHAVEQYMALSSGEREALLTFVEGL